MSHLGASIGWKGWDVMGRKSNRVILMAVALMLLLVPAIALAAGGFVDVDDDSLFIADIQWMKDAGVTKGCNPPSNTKFCPKGNVTREQMSAFMHRLAVNRVVDAGTLQGFTAAQLGGGSGSIAAGAGGRFASGTDPIILQEDTNTQLGALAITVPANGGVVDITTSVMLDTDAPASSSYVALWLTWDRNCSSSDPAVSGAVADVYNVYFANVPMNAGVSTSSGNHTIRLCANAWHSVTSDVTWVDAARISAVWVPKSMGGTVSPLSASAGDSASEYTERAKAARDARVSNSES